MRALIRSDGMNLARPSKVGQRARPQLRRSANSFLWVVKVACPLLFCATGAPLAYAQNADGSTTLVLDFKPGGPLGTAFTTSITGYDEDPYFSMEFEAVVGSGDPRLNLYRWDLATKKWSDGAILQTQGQLLDNAIYPSVVTWAGAEWVWTVGKRETPGSSVNDHLRVFFNEQANIGAGAFGSELVQPNVDPFEHSRPNIIWDANLGTRSLCWTEKDNAAIEDLNSKLFYGATWESALEWQVSAEVGDDDHCDQAVWDGLRYLVYHRVIGGGADEIFLEISSWDPLTQTLTELTEFPLLGSADANSPTIWIEPLAGGGAEVLVAAGQGPDIVVWDCAGVQTSCDSSLEFGPITSTGVSGNTSVPKVFEVTTGTKNDAYIVFENTVTIGGVNFPRVQMARRCWNQAWTYEGTLPLPPTHDLNPVMHLGVIPLAAEHQTYSFDGRIYVPFMAKTETDSTASAQFDLMMYTVLSDVVCP